MINESRNKWNMNSLCLSKQWKVIFTKYNSLLTVLNRKSSKTHIFIGYVWLFWLLINQLMFMILFSVSLGFLFGCTNEIIWNRRGKCKRIIINTQTKKSSKPIFSIKRFTTIKLRTFNIIWLPYIAVKFLCVIFTWLNWEINRFLCFFWFW